MDKDLWFEKEDNKIEQAASLSLTNKQINDIDHRNLPIECDCGCSDIEERDVVWLDGIGSTKCEYSEFCSKCGKYLGHFEYGHWEY